MGHGKMDYFHSLCKNRELSDGESSISQLKKLVKRANYHQAIVINVIQSQIGKVFLKDLFFLLIHGPNRIPKQMVTADEIFLRRSRELEHISALKVSQYNIPVSLRASNMGTSPESLNTAKLTGGDECASDQLDFECPLAAMTESVDIRSNADEEWPLGTVMRSESMINILNSPLLQQFGDAYRNDNLKRMEFTDTKDMICYDFIGSPSGFSISSSYKLEKETPMLQSHKYGSISVHQGHASCSGTNSSCSDWLSSASSTLSQGMIQCRWKRGVPRFVFSADDQKEVYMAKLSKVDPTDDKALDYVYLFHLDKVGQKGPKIPESDSQLIGKMNVSTSFTLCLNNHRLMETQFTLFGDNRIYDKEMHTSSHSHMKNKGLSKKLSEVFRTRLSSKHRTLSRFSGSNAMVESCPRQPQQYCDQGGANLLETDVPPNFELAAVVVKDHLPINKPDKVGGWGLKFLNKSGVNETELPSEICSQNSGDCSTSMSILVPAGFHGGPRARHGGPSSLIDRWRSGGCCDCGGWDEGCPLTVLQRRCSNSEVLSQADMKSKCKSVDLVAQVC